MAWWTECKALLLRRYNSTARPAWDALRCDRLFRPAFTHLYGSCTRRANTGWAINMLGVEAAGSPPLSVWEQLRAAKLLQQQLDASRELVQLQRLQQQAALLQLCTPGFIPHTGVQLMGWPDVQEPASTTGTGVFIPQYGQPERRQNGQRSCPHSPQYGQPERRQKGRRSCPHSPPGSRRRLQPSFDSHCQGVAQARQAAPGSPNSTLSACDGVARQAAPMMAPAQAADELGLPCDSDFFRSLTQQPAVHDGGWSR
ncbi:hypothetical protein ABPG75_012882 [Micractinium tetrahymenae]